VATPPDAPKAPGEAGARRAWLKSQIDAVLGAPNLAKAKIGVLVADVESGKSLYARNEKTLLNVASNVKIVTSAAALALLGPEYRFRTVVYALAPTMGPASALPWNKNGELVGDLYLRGFGDPTLDTADLSGLVSELATAGLRKIKGSLIVDETFFDGGYLAPAYDQRTDSYASRAPSSAASLNGNVVAVSVVPGPKPGSPARVVIDPPSPYFTVIGRVTTTSGAASGPQIESRASDTNDKTLIEVSGRIRVGADPRPIQRRIAHPPLYLGHTLKALLERRGIAVAEGVKTGTVPEKGLHILATRESAPLGVVVQELNKRSNNFAAEQILRTLGAEVVGRPGNWDKGLEAVARFLTSLDIKRGSYQMQNGSGLYESNRFTPEQIVTILRAAWRDFRWSAEYLASLAIAGTDGTIAHRMGGTLAERFVRAKTGTLANVSALSGFAGSPGRMPVVFSVVIGDITTPQDARRAQDRIAELLVAFVEGENNSASTGTLPPSNMSAK
jgi:D-alanyl-D-alanine carboxypeptidase/D-alanyl-D-alanine-endopeptidase (penicillin-binding protein 4)